MPGSERNDDDSSIPAFHFFRPNDSVFVVVAAFDHDVRAKGGNQFERSVFVENYDTIHAL